MTTLAARRPAGAGGALEPARRRARRRARVVGSAGTAIVSPGSPTSAARIGAARRGRERHAWLPSVASAVGATSGCCTGWGSSDAALERRPGHDERDVELVGREAAVAAVGELRVLLERAGRRVGGVDLVQRPVVLREDDDVGLVGAGGAEVVEAARAERAVRGQRACGVEPGDRRPTGSSVSSLRVDVGLRRGAGRGAGAVDDARRSARRRPR